MHLLHRFDNGHSVYFTSQAAGDARGLIKTGKIDEELRQRTGRSVRLARLNQVHSGQVCFLGRGKEADLLEEPPTADGLVYCGDSFGLGVLVADCAPVALTSAEGVFAAVHAGWRGVQKGVLAEAVKVMKSAGASNISAYIGPCIRAECYEFKGPELNLMVRELGFSIASHTSWNTSSLDLVEAVRRSLADVGVDKVDASDKCTACSHDYFSFRARQSVERHLMVVVAGGSR